MRGAGAVESPEVLSPPACAKRITLYEVEGDLPALDRRFELLDGAIRPVYMSNLWSLLLTAIFGELRRKGSRAPTTKQ